MSQIVLDVSAETLLALKMPQEEAVVFKLETEGLPAALAAAPALRAQRETVNEVSKNLITGSFLTAEKAILNGKKIRLQGNEIGNWSKASDSVSWNVDIDRPGIYSIKGNFSSERDSALTLTVDGQSVDFIIPSTSGFSTHKEIAANGSLTFKKGAIVTFTLKPTSKKDWKAVNVRELELKWEEEL